MNKSRFLLAMAMALSLAVLFLAAGELIRKPDGESENRLPVAAESAGSVTESASRGEIPPVPAPLPAPPDTREAEPEKVVTEKQPSAPEPARDEKKEGANRPRLALIIDDFGYSTNIASRILALKIPATWAVIPDAPRSEAIAKMAAENGQPFILHIPMQAIGDAEESRQFKIGVNTSAAAMEAYVAELRRRFPKAIGANNHRGSRATSDPSTMRRFMSVYASTGWGFVDSRTTAKSTAEKTAKTYRVPVVRSNFFIDGTTDLATMKSRFAKALNLAKKRGFAAAICHAREKTVPFLTYLSTLDTTPVVLVTVDELWRRHDPSKEERE